MDYYKIERQDQKSKIYKLILHPIPSIIIAFLFMVLVVICPLKQETSSLTVNNLVYLLVYLPVVSVFCFAVFFPLSYTFLNLPRVPYNLKSTILLFFVAWTMFLSIVHLVFMWIGIFPIPFEWLIISFGVGVPLIYLLVWFSISKHIKDGKDTNESTLESEQLNLTTNVNINSYTFNEDDKIRRIERARSKSISKSADHHLYDGANTIPQPFNDEKDQEQKNEIELKQFTNNINDTNNIKEMNKNNNVQKEIVIEIDQQKQEEDQKQEQHQEQPENVFKSNDEPQSQPLSQSLSQSLSISLPRSLNNRSLDETLTHSYYYDTQYQQPLPPLPTTTIVQQQRVSEIKSSSNENLSSNNTSSGNNCNGMDEEIEIGKSCSSVTGSRSSCESHFDASLDETTSRSTPNKCSSIDVQKMDKDILAPDEFISATTPRYYNHATKKPMFSKGSFFYKWWVVSSTMVLGPFGYVFFHLFLFAFYSVSDNFFQILLIISFQAVILTYKLIFRLSFHRMRSVLPNIPLRVFQDGRVLFLFWLELSSHCFFSMVFPHVGSWYMILIYLTLEAFTLTLQILVDTKTFRNYCIRKCEILYKIVYGKVYTGTKLYLILGQDGPLDRSVSLELFFFNTVARALSGCAYIVFSLAIYYGPNQDFYPTIKELKVTSYFLTLLYAGASLGTALVHMYIFKRILKNIYKINLIKRGIQLWGRRPDVAFFFITNCFILPLVVLLQQNSAVSYLLTNTYKIGN
ncbi:hypothetical protein DICPUDRAFT_57256 [Dictyostelium purpureum]|uniref:Transmembrane protein n=1 Tax=Dictyostelium purpureum TaxID=5786 RepID=F0ZV86_DICPU|nr:uncharacterized protein DICPUDRAFT_57256 [Dictyostelium purpureum]EGC32152.1 hypothetical protein DICPUDRAFT_57256 [Dictyostelium purpureum]|eukprot:XP_003291324.1 hypothetical protein DICPUDRAFT_57256 [Dictyostelium purpureum]